MPAGGGLAFAAPHADRLHFRQVRPSSSWWKAPDFVTWLSPQLAGGILGRIMSQGAAFSLLQTTMIWLHTALNSAVQSRQFLLLKVA